MRRIELVRLVSGRASERPSFDGSGLNELRMRGKKGYAPWTDTDEKGIEDDHLLREKFVAEFPPQFEPGPATSARFLCVASPSVFNGATSGIGFFLIRQSF